MLLGVGLVPITATPAEAAPCDPPVVNPVACENTLPGNPKSEWDVSGSGSATIQGFTTDISTNVGGTVQFKIDTPARSYRLDIYRMGYYGGNGARKVATVNPSAALPQNQPNCLVASTTGLVDCGNWAVSASWTVPTSAVSGIYFAKLVRTDGTTGSSHVMFIVRNDASTSAVLFQTSDTTWQAYNQYGGNSLYVGSPAGRAYKVSYNRPFTTRGTGPEDWVFNAEYPMVRFLESNGYDVSYIGRRRHRPARRADPQPQDVPVRRTRRVLVRQPARERRGGPRRRREPRLLQRQRVLLEDQVRDQHRRLEHRVPDAGHLQGDARQRRDRPGRPADLDGHLA